MKKLYRRVLQKVSSYLPDNLEANDELIDEIYSDLAIDTHEKECISQEKSNREKLKCMIKFLLQKDDTAYDIFKECLKKTKNEHVLEKMQEAEHLCRQELSSQDESETKQLILKFFKSDKPEMFISCEEVKDILFNDPILRSGSFDFDDVQNSEWLVNLVKSTFPAAKEGTRPTSNRNKKERQRRSELVFFGVTWKVSSEDDYKRERQESESSECSDIQTNDVKDMLESENEPGRVDLPVEDFNKWLIGILKQHSGDLKTAEKIAEKFKQDEIDSIVFETLTEEELTSYIPIIGQRKKIIMCWKEHKKTLLYTRDSSQIATGQSNPNVQRQYHPLRQFEEQATFKLKYTKGAFATDIEKRRGNLLFPVHKFFDFKKRNITKQRDVTTIATEIVKFGAACMNDRTNGTIHFGINSTGEIEGKSVDHSKLERTITKRIRESFYDCNVSIALNCIRPPQFIEVIGDKSATMNLFVIEVDVVPSAKFVEDIAFFLKPTEDNQSQCVLYRYDSDIKLMNPRELDEFMTQEKNKLFLSRKEIETRKLRNTNQNRNKVLQDFLCCGDEHFDQSLYPILLLHDMHSSMKQDLQFLKYINWRAIFDFNNEGESSSPQKYLEKDCELVFNTNFIEDFDPKKTDKNHHDQIIDNLKTTSLPNWVYCNGSGDTYTEDLSDWKMNRRSSFMKAIECHENISPPGRSRVLIPVFDSKSNLLIEAAEEFLLRFKGQCLFISESENDSCILRDALQKRSVFPQNFIIDDFFVIGIPWKQVSEAVCRFEPALEQVDRLEVPTSTGVPEKLPLELTRQLCDLHILAANECSSIKYMTDEEKEKHRRTHGENFYKGGTVSWPNFYFSNQVLVREVHRDLQEYVRDVVKGDKNYTESVQTVIIYHQPGAGGSTTSRQLLWEMRDKYRCCVVKSMTRQTVEQINCFRNFQEGNNENTLPVVVLIDLDEEESVARLKDELIQSQKHNYNVSCVMIICSRVYELPVKRTGASVFIKQHLTDSELEWFRDKYDDLSKRHKRNKGCDPDTLLSLNLMKENFKMDDIHKLVTKYVGDPLLTKEHRTLLKYLAFLNHYDINFQAVPTNSFDRIMGRADWLKQIPQSLKVLINETKVNGANGHIPCLRIANYLISETVFKEVSNESGKPTSTIGEVATDLLESKIINPHDTSEQNKKFEIILADIIKKRGFQPCSKRQNKFSRLIMELLDQNDHDTAIDIVDKIYAITDDPMVAQQLSRLHAEVGNWEDAHRSIEKAMKKKEDNSFLAHTCGQNYKMEFERYCKGKTNSYDDERTIQILQIAQKSQFYFRESQRISRLENSSPQNPAGFEGEIQLGIEVLVKQHLSDVKRICEGRKHVMPVKGNEVLDCICNFMNDLYPYALVAIQILQADIYVMQTSNFPLQNENSLTSLARGKLESYKQKLDDAWHKSQQENRNEQPAIQSFIDAINAGESTLTRTVESLQYPEKTVYTIRIFLASTVELYLRNSQSFKIDKERVLHLSRMFLEKLPETNPTCILEAHLMLVALHWPLESKANFRDLLCPHSYLIKALSSWQRIINEKPTKLKSVDKIIFFISEAQTFPCLIKADKIRKDNVSTFKGKVCSNGSEFEITPHTYRTGSISNIKIPALNQIKMSSKWNKETDVVIGFGLHGPKADLLENVASHDSHHSPRHLLVAGCSQARENNQQAVIRQGESTIRRDIYVRNDDRQRMHRTEQNVQKMDCENPKGLTALWVGNIQPDKVDRNMLFNMFSSYGNVTYVNLLPDKFCAFIHYSSPESAATAMQALQGHECGGKRLLIKYPDNPRVNHSTMHFSPYQEYLQHQPNWR